MTLSLVTTLLLENPSVRHLLTFTLLQQKSGCTLKGKLLPSIAIAGDYSLQYLAENRVEFLLFIFHLFNEKRGLVHFHIWKNLHLVHSCAHYSYFGDIRFSAHITPVLLA